MGTYAKYLYRKYQVNPNTIVECPDEYSIVSLVRENFGIALMPQTDILLSAEGIKIHKIMGLEIYRQVFMFWMKDQIPSSGSGTIYQIYEGTAGR